MDEETGRVTVGRGGGKKTGAVKIQKQWRHHVVVRAGSAGSSSAVQCSAVQCAGPELVMKERAGD